MAFPQVLYGYTSCPTLTREYTRETMCTMSVTHVLIRHAALNFDILPEHLGGMHGNPTEFFSHRDSTTPRLVLILLLCLVLPSE